MLSVYPRHYPLASKEPRLSTLQMSRVDSGNYRVGDFIRHTAKTRSWEKAQTLVHNLENPEEATPANLPEPAQSGLDLKRTTIEVAVETFLSDPNSRGVQEPTQQKLKHLCRRQLLDWAKTESLLYLDELTTANPTNFRDG